MSRTAFLFPGQGSQRPGMGRALANAFPESRAVFEEADDVLGESLSTLCFEGPSESLQRTRNTQPAMLTVSVAAWRAAAARAPSPDMAAGHSLGEYSALVALGGLTFADAVRLTRRRAELMQEAVPAGQGGMAAVLGLPAETVASVTAEVTSRGDGLVQPANFNGGGQVVIGGHAAAVAAAGAELKARGARRVLPLPVSAPFHTRLMEPAVQPISAELEAIPFGDLSAPLWTNVDAAPIRTGAEAREALRRQVASPVRWEDSLLGMAAAGASAFIEIGQGRVLTGLVRKVLSGAEAFGVSDPEGIGRLQKMRREPDPAAAGSLDGRASPERVAGSA